MSKWHMHVNQEKKKVVCVKNVPLLENLLYERKILDGIHLIFLILLETLHFQTII